MGKTVSPAWIQGHYKLIDRSTDTSVASWVFKAEDTAWTQTSAVSNVGVVIGWGESAGQTTSTSSGTITLQYRINGGSWVTVGAATAVKYANSAAVTDGGTYGTAYTTAPTGVAAFSGTGEYDENNSVGAQTPVDTYYEALFALALDSAQLADSDVITFQLLMGGVVFTSVDAVPTLTYFSPNKTAALTGSAVTTSAGTLGVTHTNALSGSAVTTSAGTLTPVSGIEIALTGEAVTSSSGTLGVTHDNILSGSAVTSSAGTLGVSVSVPLTGEAVTTSAGTITPNVGGDVSVALTGSEVATSAGTLGVINSAVASQLAGGGIGHGSSSSPNKYRLVKAVTEDEVIPDAVEQKAERKKKLKRLANTESAEPLISWEPMVVKSFVFPKSERVVTRNFWVEQMAKSRAHAARLQQMYDDYQRLLDEEDEEIAMLLM